QSADAGRTIYLVTGENVEVAIQSLHVHFEMRHGLGSINQHWDVTAVCHFYDPLDRIDRAECVLDVGYGDDFGSRSQQVLKVLEQQFAAVADWRNPQPCALLFAQDLPGHDVGVMLHGGDEHFVAGVNVSAAVGLRHEVDGFRGAANKDYLARISGVEERLHLPPRCFVLFRRMFGKEMHATMDVGIVPLVVTADGINDHLRLLGRGCIVQIDQRPAANPMSQDRKTPADFLHIEPGAGVAHVRWARFSGQSLGGGGHPISSQFLPVSSRRFSVGAPGAELAIWCRQWLISPSTYLRTGPCFMRSRHSLAKAKSRNLRADTSSMPRERR